MPQGSNDPLPISRSVVRGRFVYTRRGQRITNKKSIERIEGLAIPPAWTDVEIATSPSSKVLARGIDAAGRVQAIYNPKFRAKQERAKFARATRFAEALPKLREQVERDLRKRSLRRERVIACVVKLMDDELFRIGSPRYAEEHESYGITTVRKTHIDANGSSVTFSFVGKSGKPVERVVKDRRVVGLVQKLTDLRGDELFTYVDDEEGERPVIRSQVNAYLRKAMGEEFSAKDFRTWGGTVHAMEALLDADTTANLTANDIAKLHREAVKSVAERLGNTPAVARESYIDPRLFARVKSIRKLRELRRIYGKLRNRKHFSRVEQLTLRVLKSR